jgi:serine/threonine protein kinase/tetratricopeptide (TPR) repeat protein
MDLSARAPVVDADVTPPPAPIPDLLGTVKNWSSNNGRPLLPIDPEPAEVIDGLRHHDPDKADRLREAVDRFPAVGSELAGFHLAAILGRGTFGRVYLARQGDLADRYVALKVSTDLAGESRTLAQLQHTNIVPVYSIHKLHLLQAVCMPFFGATTVAALLRRYRARESMPATGRELVDTLNGLSIETDIPDLPPTHVPTSSVGSGVMTAAPEVSPLPAGRRAGASPAVLHLLRGLTYVDAVCWLGSRLADALAHAHERGIVHNDLKPANILVTDEGQPMLLDFGVSEDLKLRTEARSAPAGGTVPYMSPEHLDAVHKKSGCTDPRSDVYAIGIILFELLTGRHPFRLPTGKVEEELPRMAAERRAGPPLVRPFNRAVTPGLESIVRKCLEPGLAKRYQSAADLRDDLERFRSNQPLKHAKDPSARERFRKWARRHPRLTSNVTLCTVAIVTVGLLTVGFDRRGQRIAEYQAEAARQEARDQAAETFRQVGGDLRAAQYQLTTRAPDRDMIAAGVEKCRTALYRYGLPGNADWEQQPAVANLSDDDRHRLRQQVADLAVLQARGLMLQGGDDRLAEALRLNELAGRMGGAQKAILTQRAELYRRRGNLAEAEAAAAEADRTPLVGARDYYLAGTEALSAGEYQKAISLLQQAADREPTLFWAHMALGVCQEGVGRFANAQACYTTAVAVWPDSPYGHLNRGLVGIRIGSYPRAKADLDKAAELAPDFAEVYATRAVALQGLGQYAAGIADLDRAERLGTDAVRVCFMRSRLKELTGDKDGAKKDFEAGLRAEPTDDKGYIARGNARVGTDPKAALADFQAAAKLNPRSLAAHQNMAHVLGKLKKPEEAAAALGKVLDAYPDFVPARAGRGVMYGRLGKWAEAKADAEAALKKDNTPANQYQVAGIYALLTKDDPKHLAEAVRLLRDALRGGFGFEHLDADPDLDPIRQTAEFKTVADGARSLKAVR